MIRQSFKTAKGTELPLRNFKGKEYLDVKDRVIWFREERPTWRIETEMIHFDRESAMFKAIIRDEQGNIMATGHKTETIQDFPAGHAEKSETGAIGRALALVGYGTQFTDDLDEGERVVDAPKEPRQSPPSPASSQKPSDRKPTISDAQGKRAYAIAKAKGWDSEGITQELHRIAKEGYGVQGGFFYLSRLSYDAITKSIELGLTADQIIEGATA